MKFPLVAISTGPITHLDHLAPLCFILEVPLIVTDPEQEKLGKFFYPMVDLEYIPFSELSLEMIAHNFNAIITSGKFWAMELGPSIEMLFGKKIQFIFAPHGQSDKETLLNRPVSQECELVYSPKQDQSIVIGNIRRWFYEKYKTHFDKLSAPFFTSSKKTVLYAPTWQTTATTTSFFDHADRIISTLNESYNLLIKLHPLLEENNPAAFHRIIGKYEQEVQFILDFPPVYPLLEKTDIYLGDFSSVGYDFLWYDRPMFFIATGEAALQKCGESFEGNIDSDQKHLSMNRKELYQKTFAACDPLKIKALLRRFSNIQYK